LIQFPQGQIFNYPLDGQGVHTGYFRIVVWAA